MRYGVASNRRNAKCRAQAPSSSRFHAPRSRFSLIHQGNTRPLIIRWFVPRSFSWQLPAWKTSRSLSAWRCPVQSSQSGGNGSSANDWMAWRTFPGAGDRALFPPESIVEIKALACEIPSRLGLPFSRLSHADIATQAVVRCLVVSISVKTVWRYLHADAIKPWTHRSWLFPRDPAFAEKASRVLDLYFRYFHGIPLGPDDYVISADEKTSIQARHRKAIGTGPMPNQPRRVEFEYERKGALAYLAAWDVHGAKLFGLCEKSTGIEPFHKLVDLVMQQEPYRSARRVFWITDNGSSHRGETSVQRLLDWYPNAIQIHTPIHASWLNQVEIIFSVLQRKVLKPNDFPDLERLETAIFEFQALYNQIAKPFKWKYTKNDLKKTLSRFQDQAHNRNRVCLAA